MYVTLRDKPIGASTGVFKIIRIRKNLLHEVSAVNINITTFT